SAWTHLTHTFYDGVFFVHAAFKSLADTMVSSTFFALPGAKNLLGQKRDLIMSKHLLTLHLTSIQPLKTQKGQDITK
ncbi:MAG: hypothetical protein KI786_10700, partial [Mameliella sp.]|nr:hypothetical protein [Phaeodactylibacter sp.]